MSLKNRVILRTDNKLTDIVTSNVLWIKLRLILLIEKLSSVKIRIAHDSKQSYFRSDDLQLLFHHKGTNNANIVP